MGKTRSHSKKGKSDEIDRIICGLEQRVDGSILEELVQGAKKKSGRPAKAKAIELLKGLVWHALSEVGTLGAHFAAVTGKRLAESSLSERRSNIAWEVFSQILSLFLRPLAHEKKHPEAFYQGYRLVGVDGTEFSLRNTSRILQHCSKGVSRRVKAAFAKVRVCVLVELAIHNPIAAAVGSRQESEAVLSALLLYQLPEHSLLLADRYYGNAQVVSQFMRECPESRFLFRVNKRNKSSCIKKLEDGSRLVEVAVRDQEHPSRIKGHVKLREIRATLRRKGFQATSVRLWTNFLSAKQAPATELVELYARRWEHETYYREVKLSLGDGNLLASQGVETACQEIAALLIASSIVAEHRIKAAKSGLKVTDISFAHTLFNVRCLWEVMPLLSTLLTAKQLNSLADKLREKLRPDKLPKKRFRSCPRAVRQPIKGWPRLLKNSYSFGQPQFTIV
jgi:hypothetical protein